MPRAPRSGNDFCSMGMGSERHGSAGVVSVIVGAGGAWLPIGCSGDGKHGGPYTHESRWQRNHTPVQVSPAAQSEPCLAPVPGQMLLLSIVVVGGCMDVVISAARRVLRSRGSKCPLYPSAGI